MPISQQGRHRRGTAPRHRHAGLHAGNPGLRPQPVVPAERGHHLGWHRARVPHRGRLVRTQRQPASSVREAGGRHRASGVGVGTEPELRAGLGRQDGGRRQAGHRGVVRGPDPVAGVRRAYRGWPGGRAGADVRRGQRRSSPGPAAHAGRLGAQDRRRQPVPVPRGPDQAAAAITTAGRVPAAARP